MKSRPLLIVLVVHLVFLLLAVPESPWEYDEPRFFQALHDYDPIAHHPPPPGYPVFIHFAQVVRLLIPSDFATLLAISFFASVIGFVMLALAFRNIAGDETTGIIGAMFFYWSPAMLIHSTLPVSEPGAFALVAATLYFATKPSPALLALFAALTIGWRMQFSIFVVPMFLTAVTMMRNWRERRQALAIFTLVCLAWLTPLMTAVGGPGELLDYELQQGKYVAAHDATESRTGWTPVRLAFRFLGRAWGAETMALVVLAIAALGFAIIVRRRLVSFLPLAAGAAVYIAVALLVMDPADGVRYSLPFVLATAFAAAAGARAISPRFPYAVPALAGVAFLLYVNPLLQQRRSKPSPPVQAAAYARHAFPPNAVVLYELSLEPHARYYLADRNPHRVDDGLAKFWNRPDVPLFLFTDGATPRAEARVFRWKPSDAYTKLTRNHYRASSIIPLPPERRFRIVRGVYAQEREQEGLEWRWLDSIAEIQLPPGSARNLTLSLGLPRAAPIESNLVRVFVDGKPATTVPVTRTLRSGEVTLDVPAGSPVIRFESERSFIPAEVPAMRSGDRRRLAVELYDVRASAPRLSS